MRITALGSGGWIPSRRRETCCYVVDTGDELIMLDTGTGVCRLQEHSDLLDGCEAINIVYSHYHLDHLVGLTFLLNWLDGRKLRIWGPGPPYYSQSCAEILETFTSPPFFPRPISVFSDEVEIYDFPSTGADFRIGKTLVQLNEQRHSAPTFGIRLDDKLYYATDTVVLQSTFERAHGVDLLLHECWQAVPILDHGHSSTQELREALNGHQVNHLGLIHLNPNWEPADEAAALATFPAGSKVSLVTDGTVFEL